MSAAADRFSISQVVAVLAVGITGILIPGLQPQLLGALADEGHLSIGALGALASTELLAMGLAAGAAGFVLPVSRLRPIAAIALIGVAEFNFLTPLAASGWIFALRIFAGLGEGVLVWIAIGLIVRSERPERWSGIYLATQTLAQFALATILGSLVLVHAGAGAGFTALGLVTLASLAALPWLPRGFGRLVATDGVGGRPPARGLVALAGVLVYLAFVVGVWVYLEPLAGQRGVGGATWLIAPVSLAMQVLGAAAATLSANRLPARPVVVLVTIANLALLAVMAAASTPWAFVAASAAFGFLWLFVLPFQIPIVIAADPSRRSAMLIGGAQLVGSSAGPVLAGLVVGARDVSPVIGFGAACALIGTLVLIAAGHRPRRSTI